MGIFLRNQGLTYLSLPYHSKSIELDPFGKWAYAARGRAYYNIGEYDEAEEDFQSGLKIEEDDYWTLYLYFPR